MFYSGFLGRNFINLGRNKLTPMTLRWNLIKYIQFDGFINGVMFYFYLVAVMVGITGFTGFSFFRKMMSYVFRGTIMS